MPQTGLVHPQHHNQHSQQIRGYDEDWDDDVYYATTCAAGDGESSDQAKASDEDYRVSESEKSGRDRSSTKRHYMKIPNMRQLRAMRSTTGSLSSSERVPSPFTSLVKDLGDTATPSSASGEGSMPLVDRRSHSPSLPRDVLEAVHNDHTVEETNTTISPPDSAPSPAGSPQDGCHPHPHDERTPSSRSTRDGKADDPKRKEQRVQAADRPLGNDCLVQLRGSSPRLTKSLGGSPFSAASPSGEFPTVDAEGRIKARSLHIAVSQASSGGGSAGKKRKLLPNGAGAGPSPGAWPKLPGEQSSQAKRSRSLDMDAHGDGLAVASRKGDAVTVPDGYQESLKSVDGKRQRYRERDWLSSSGSSSSLSATSDGDHAAIGGGGTNAPKRSSTVMERPARWKSKGSATTSRSPLQSPGARARPPLHSRGSSGVGNGNKAQQSRPGFSGRAERRARGTLANKHGGRTLKLSAVFQASSSSSSLRLKSRRGGSSHPPVRGGQGDTSDMPSFDPTCIGTTRSIVKETEDVEDVASDDEAPMADGSANRFANGLGIGRGGETVDDFEEQLLGEDRGTDSLGSTGKSSPAMRRTSARAIVAETDDGEDGSKEVGYSGPESLVVNGRGLGSETSRTSNALGELASGTAMFSSPSRQEGDVISADSARATSQAKELPTQRGRLRDASPPPRTPAPSRPRAFTPSSFKRGPSCSSSASGRQGKWRPSFGGGDGSAVHTPGSMHAPWAVFSTPSGASVDVSVGSGAGSTRRRGSGAGNGYLGKLLQQVRTRFDGDEARLLSGEFPFRQTPAPSEGNAARDGEVGSDRSGGAAIGRRDHGDPRTRCRVALDVVVLPTGGKQRDAPGAAAFGEDASCDRMSGSVRLSCFPCFVHGVVDVSIGPSGSTNEKAVERLRALEGTRVNALFNQNTRRALDLCPGSQLRIYDPCCISHSEVEGGSLLMCTQLCEPFPACFPPLPEPPDSSDVGNQSAR